MTPDRLATWGLAFVAGLAGSAHCLGMCGALVVSVSRCIPNHTARGQLIYASGRVLAYGFLGAVFGLAGSFVVVASALETFQGWILLIAGLLVVALALTRLTWGDGFAPAPPSLLKLLHRARASIAADGDIAGIFLLGCLNSLIPCGLLYTMQLRAAAAGSAWDGMFMMVAFGLGTVPALFALSVAGARFTLARRQRVDRLASVALVLLGVQILLRAAAHLGWVPHTLFW